MHHPLLRAFGAIALLGLLPITAQPQEMDMEAAQHAQEMQMRADEHAQDRRHQAMDHAMQLEANRQMADAKIEQMKRAKPANESKPG